MNYLPVYMLFVLLVGCGPAAPPPLPTARVMQRTMPQVVVLPTLTPAPASPLPTPLPTAAPAPPSPTPNSPETQYRAWIEEARATHPYSESTEHMWNVMICESGGQPQISNGINIGLFQYHPNTWAGSWNSYRDQPITDARAQIFATAKAWQEGHQGWWSCYGVGG